MKNSDIQNLILDTVKEFIKVCENYKLQWFFIGGSLIGVILFIYLLGR